MTPDVSLWSLIAHAGAVVKIIMLILLAASVASWTIIFQRVSLFKSRQQQAKIFEQYFWSGINLNQLFKESADKKSSLVGLESIFYSGFSEFLRLQKQSHVKAHVVMQAVSRAMRIAYTREMDILENHLSFLASVGSTSPYLGIFGTVWGIMTSFRALSGVQQASIAMVAPGISEALIATAIGLFAAIPAVVAHHRFAHSIERLENTYVTFQDEFASILHRQLHAGTKKDVGIRNAIPAEEFI